MALKLPPLWGNLRGSNDLHGIRPRLRIRVLHVPTVSCATDDAIIRDLEADVLHADDIIAI